MPNVNRRGKIIIVITLALLLIVIGALFFPVPQPDVHLAANYGLGDHGPEPFFTLGPIYFSNTLITSLMSVPIASNASVKTWRVIFSSIVAGS